MRIAPLVALVACALPGGPGAAPLPGDPPAPPAADTQVDRVVQVVPLAVDVLWVVDTSPTTEPHLPGFAEAFPAFLDVFGGAGLDGRVGLTSTALDPSGPGTGGALVDASGRPWVDGSGPDPASLLLGLPRSDGGSPRGGLGATYLALEVERDGANAGFRRDDAALHTIVVDAGPDATPTPLPTGDAFVAWYAAQGAPATTTFSSIADPVEGGAYRAATTALGGATVDLGDEAWPATLAAVGLLASGLQREYFLSRLPVPETLSVSVEEASGVRLAFDPADWVYDEGRNSVTFVSYVPGPLATVALAYTVRSAP